MRLHRETLELSQEKLAERCGLHWTYIGLVERGQRNLSLHNIVRIAAALETDPGELVQGLGSEDRPPPRVPRRGPGSAPHPHDGVERGKRNRTLQSVERIARTIWGEAAEWESNKLLPPTYPVVRPLLIPGRSQFGHKQPVRERYGS